MTVQMDLSTLLAAVNLLAVVIGLAVSFTTLKNRVGNLDDKFTEFRNRVEKADLFSADREIALIKQRQNTHGEMLSTVQKRIDELAHGKGYVDFNPAKAVKDD